MPTLTFKGEPCPAARPRVARGGWAYYPKKYTDFKKVLGKFFKDASPTKLLVPLVVTITILIKRPKTTKLGAPRPDFDNYAKAVCDAGNGVLWDDDTQIIDGRCTKAWTSSESRIIINYEEATPQCVP